MRPGASPSHPITVLDDDDDDEGESESESDGDDNDDSINLGETDDMYAF